VRPEYRSSLLGGHAREGAIAADKSLLDKLFDIAIVKHAMILWLTHCTSH
jgi:hypothetical protein